MGLWAKSLRIFNAFCDNAKQSIRQVAHQTGFSKSSVHRLTQAMKGRDKHPESWWWETEAGRCWLIRLVVAPLYTFGLKRGVGAETISEFFGRLRLETHVGCSPSALSGVLHALEQAILETATAWEYEGVAAGEVRPIIGAVDETFLERMMLVFMDLVSGYLLFEEVAEDRTYTTWYALVEARLEALGVGVWYLVSDRAKALIKRAEQGREGVSIPEVFHRIHDLVQSYALAMCRPLRQARQAVHQARESLPTCQVPHRSSAEAQRAPAEVEACAAEVERWASVHSAYRPHRETVSRLVPPWRLCNSTPQTSQEVERRWHAEIDAITACIAPPGLPAKQQAVDKVHKQLAGVSALVDVWWQSVGHDVQPVAMTPMGQRWGDEPWLPRLYGQPQVSRTRCPRRKAKLVQALEAVQATVDRPPITRQLAADVLEGWKAWAAEHAKAFQRASSAVEGRNGALAQLHHHQRGLPKQRDKVWTVRHNFDGRAPDGTTPAARFFRRGFPDLCETVLSTIDDLPRPRKRHQAMTLSG
jgi:Family of unknown function (DUF6399)/IclR helix-turn-helix domain